MEKLLTFESEEQLGQILDELEPLKKNKLILIVYGILNCMIDEHSLLKKIDSNNHFERIGMFDELKIENNIDESEENILLYNKLSYSDFTHPVCTVEGAQRYEKGIFELRKGSTCSDQIRENALSLSEEKLSIKEVQEYNDNPCYMQRLINTFLMVHRIYDRLGTSKEEISSDKEKELKLLDLELKDAIPVKITNRLLDIEHANKFTRTNLFIDAYDDDIRGGKMYLKKNKAVSLIFSTRTKYEKMMNVYLKSTKAEKDEIILQVLQSTFNFEFDTFDIKFVDCFKRCLSLWKK